jgi:hypothetical protein
MKIFIGLLVAGTLGTLFIFNSASKLEPRQASAPRAIKYEQVNESALNQIKDSLVAEKNRGPAVTAVQTAQVEGKTAFAEGMVQLFTFLKTNQVLYRYEVNNSLKNYLDKMGQVKTDQVEAFNKKMNEVLDSHKNTVSRLNFNQTIKDNARALIEGLKNPLKIKTITTSRVEENKSGKFLAKIENALQDLTIEKEIYLHTPEVETPKAPIVPVVALWTSLSLITFFFLRKKTVITTEAEELVNPTFKRIMSDLDYPLVMVDQGLNIVWQNKKSEASPYELSTLQEIFKTNAAEEGEIKIDGKFYAVNVSELSYKSGRKNFLAQLKPKLASNKNLEHLIDYGDVSALIESHNPSVAFGDVNQSVAQLSVKLGYLFKVSGKFLDLNFNKDISDCFIESERLEGMLKEFIMGCHHIIKDDSEVSGIYLRTNETGNKFAVSCFLMNFRSDALESHPLTRDFLRRFSILEAKYAICNPAIEFRFKETSEFKGLDITMSFENRSELELIVNNMSANA